MDDLIVLVIKTCVLRKTTNGYLKKRKWYIRDIKMLPLDSLLWESYSVEKVAAMKSRLECSQLQPSCLGKDIDG